jgi:hypothetical protein
VDPFIKYIVTDRLEKAKKGIVSPVVWIDTMKDERRSFAKVAAKKTRIFSTGMFDHNICGRMYFGAFMMHVTQNHDIGNISVGINIDNVRNSTAFYKQLKGFGSHWIAGDYSAYDKRLPYSACMAGIEVINRWYNDCAENQLVRRVLAEGLFAGFRLAGRHLYKADHGMPSGTPLTAIGNSVINSFLMRCVFKLANYLHEPNELINFDGNVREKYYGDDNLLRVSNRAGRFFNLHTISELMTECFGMTYTNADKSEIIDNFTPEDKVSYLKRFFHERHGEIFAAMPMKDLTQMILWHRQGCTPGEYHGSLRCFCLFLSRHPKEVYDKEIEHLRLKLDKRFPLLSYEVACDLVDATD